MPRKPATKKVGTKAKKPAEKAPETTEEKKPTRGRGASTKPNFDLASAVNGEKPIELDDKGRLTGIPTNFDSSFNALTASQFSNKEIYYRFQASRVDEKIETLNKRKTELLERAEDEKSGADPVKVKVRKAEKMRKQLAELEKQLEEEGIEF